MPYPARRWGTEVFGPEGAWREVVSRRDRAAMPTGGRRSEAGRHPTGPTLAIAGIFMRDGVRGRTRAWAFLPVGAFRPASPARRAKLLSVIPPDDADLTEDGAPPYATVADQLVSVSLARLWRTLQYLANESSTDCSRRSWTTEPPEAVNSSRMLTKRFG